MAGDGAVLGGGEADAVPEQPPLGTPVLVLGTTHKVHGQGATDDMERGHSIFFRKKKALATKLPNIDTHSCFAEGKQCDGMLKKAGIGGAEGKWNRGRRG